MDISTSKLSLDENAENGIVGKVIVVIAEWNSELNEKSGAKLACGIIVPKS